MPQGCQNSGHQSCMLAQVMVSCTECFKGGMPSIICPCAYLLIVLSSGYTRGMSRPVYESSVHSCVSTYNSRNQEQIHPQVHACCQDARALQLRPCTTAVYVEYQLAVIIIIHFVFVLLLKQLLVKLCFLLLLIIALFGSLRISSVCVSPHDVLHAESY